MKMLHPDYLEKLSAYEFQKHLMNQQIREELITLLHGFEKKAKDEEAALKLWSGIASDLNKKK